MVNDHHANRVFEIGILKAMNHLHQKRQPLVSIIVPVWNVEPYIRQCLDSIVSQSYQNLEIICVDDGSPDHCPEICDEYAARDSRIKVIHKENGGVAQARNTALRVVSGEWIAWIDSDDWVSAQFIQYMLNNALQYDADIVICGRYEEYTDRRNVFSPEFRIMNSEQAIKELLQDDEIRNYLCDKLWRANLFHGLAFSENYRVLEDVALVYRLFLQAGQIVCCPEAHYHYRIHDKGLTHNNTLINELQVFQIRKERREAVSAVYPRLKEALQYDCLCSAISVWRSYYKSDRQQRREKRTTFSEVSAYVRQNRPGERFLNSCGKAERLVIQLSRYDTWWSLVLADFFNRLYRLKNGGDICRWTFKENGATK